MRSDEKKIILFDGVCNLCNTTVSFLMKRDRRDVFRFAPLQTEPGTRLAQDRGIPTADLDSVVLVETNDHYVKSTAALRIARELPGAYRFLYPLILIPRGLRDAIYDLVARNRYRWFGRQESCRVPTPEERGKFLT